MLTGSLSLLASLITGSLLYIGLQERNYVVLATSIAMIIFIAMLLYAVFLNCNYTDEKTEKLDAELSGKINSLKEIHQNGMIQLKSDFNKRIDDLREDMQNNTANIVANYDALLGQHLSSILDSHLTNRLPEITNITKGVIYEELKPIISELAKQR